MIERIVSGGQTGVDQGALEVALGQGMACGGWCPRGRRTEAGVMAARYPLRETDSEDYRVRTEWNVRDSDATLILNQGALQGGTALTVRLAERLGRPCLVVDLDQPFDSVAILAWLQRHQVRVLNVAGPRESGRPGIGARAQDWMERLLDHTRIDAHG